MATATLTRKRKRREPEPEYKFGLESNGTMMTPEEFDDSEWEDFDQNWSYELINGVLVVSPIPLIQESDPNEELGHWLRTYQENHPDGKALDFILIEQYVKCGRNRRKPDRSIWTGLGRLPRKTRTRRWWSNLYRAVNVIANSITKPNAVNIRRRRSRNIGSSIASSET